VYKAQRAARTKEEKHERISLYARMAHLRETVLNQLFPWAEVPEREADDLLFSLSRGDGEFLIYTNDKDLLQAVDGDRVMQVKSHRSNLYVWDEEKVRDKYNVGPLQLPLLRAILGDPSDNLPGCKAFGAGKTSDYVREAYRAYDPGHGELYHVLMAIVKIDIDRDYWSKTKADAWRAFIDADLLRLNFETMLFKAETVQVQEPGRNEALALEQLRNWEIKSLRFPDGLLEGALCEEEEF
jgi:5'-3' exonuclease